MKLVQYNECLVSIVDTDGMVYYGSKLWNLLPSDIKHSTSMYEFCGKVTECCFTLSPNDFDIF